MIGGIKMKEIKKNGYIVKQEFYAKEYEIITDIPCCWFTNDISKVTLDGLNNNEHMIVEYTDGRKKRYNLYSDYGGEAICGFNYANFPVLDEMLKDEVLEYHCLKEKVGKWENYLFYDYEKEEFRIVVISAVDGKKHIYISPLRWHFPLDMYRKYFDKDKCLHEINTKKTLLYYTTSIRSQRLVKT